MGLERDIINEGDEQGGYTTLVYLSRPGLLLASTSICCWYPSIPVDAFRGDVSLPGSSVPFERTKTNPLWKVFTPEMVLLPSSWL